MQSKWVDKKKIFESPDGGKTVYERNIGDDYTKRKIIIKIQTDFTFTSISGV